MSYDAKINEIQEFIKEKQESVKKLEALNRLAKNKDFKLLIDNGYFVDEATRLVMLKASPCSASDEDQKNIMRGIDSVGYLRQYFATITTLGREAERRIEEAEYTIQSLKEEALEDGNLVNNYTE